MAIPTRAEAWQLLCEYTQNENLRAHALAVEACLRAYARRQASTARAWARRFSFWVYSQSSCQASARVGMAIATS